MKTKNLTLLGAVLFTFYGCFGTNHAAIKRNLDYKSCKQELNCAKFYCNNRSDCERDDCNNRKWNYRWFTAEGRLVPKPTLDSSCESYAKDTNNDYAINVFKEYREAYLKIFERFTNFYYNDIKKYAENFKNNVSVIITNHDKEGMYSRF